MRPLLSLLMVAGFLGSLYFNWSLYKGNAAKEQELAKQDALIKRLDDELRVEKRKNQTEVRADRDTLEKLRQDLAAKKAALNTLEQQLHVAHNVGIVSQDLPSLKEEVNQRQIAVQELEQQMKGIKTQVNQLGAQSKATVAQTKAEQKLQLDQLADQITAKQNTVHELTAKAEELRKDQIMADAQQQLRETENQLQQERTALENLRAQRKQLNDTYNAAIAQNQGETETGKTTLTHNEEQIRDQYQAAKEALQEAQSRLKLAQTSKSSQVQSLQKLEDQYRDQKAKVQEAEAELHRVEYRLQEMEQH